MSSAEMFTAPVEDMAESPNVGQVKAWCTTIRASIAEAVNAVPVQTEVFAGGEGVISKVERRDSCIFIRSK